MKSRTVCPVLRVLAIGTAVFCVQQTVPFLPPAPSWDPASVSPEAVDITLADVLRLQRKDGTRIVDLREARFAACGRIPGAVNMRALPSPEELAVLKSATNIIVYENERSGDATWIFGNHIRQYGISGLKSYAGGWKEWKSCGLPVEK